MFILTKSDTLYAKLLIFPIKGKYQKNCVAHSIAFRLTLGFPNVHLCQVRYAEGFLAILIS